MVQNSSISIHYTVKPRYLAPR